MTHKTDPEIWKTVVDFPAYSVSTHGRVRRDAIVHGGGGSIRIPSGFMKFRALPLGHLQVTLSIGNKVTTVLVHRLVAKAFLPPPPPGKNCVCHRDDNPSNNRPGNLFWGTRRDNTDDMISKGRQAKGETSGTSKLTTEQVLDMRRRVDSGENQYDIAKDFGVTQSNVSMIATRKTWRHV